MRQSARTARQIINARRAAAKDARKGLHTLASHARKAGLIGELATTVAGALRGKAKALNIVGKKSRMVRRTEALTGVKSVPVRGGRRFSVQQFRAIVAKYAPRVARYVEARTILLAY